MAVALVGGIALLPMVIAGLWGGMIADAFDRRRVLIVSSLTGWVAVLGLVALSSWDAALVADGQRAQVWPFYVLTTVNTVAATVSGATRSAVTTALHRARGAQPEGSSPRRRRRTPGTGR